MTNESFWVRAYIRRGDDLDVVKEIECVSETAAATTAERLWSKEIYDRTEATADETPASGGRASRRAIVLFGHAAAPTAKAPADFEQPVPAALGTRPRTAPKA